MIKLETREVHIVHIGCQVNGAVMEQVARNLTDAFSGFLKDIKYFVCDHDPRYTTAFREILESSGVDVIRTSVGWP